jgi:hypothetical protein
MTTPTLLLTPRRTALLADHDNALDVLVRIQAPELPAGASSGTIGGWLSAGGGA